MNRTLLALAAIAAMARCAAATPVIDVGDHLLAPNTSGQTVLIFVSGGDLVEGLNLNAQVADGGTELAGFGGSIDGPAISDVDVVTATIFAGNNTGADDPEALFGTDFSQLELRTITTSAGTVPADGLLATLTIDTTGFSSGVFGLHLALTVNGPTDFAGVPATIADGSITVVPEPATSTLMLLAAGVLGALWRHRKRA